jgi:hypothetical protein
VIETSTTIQTSDGSAAARGLDVATGGYLRVKRSTSALELVGGAGDLLGVGGDLLGGGRRPALRNLTCMTSRVSRSWLDSVVAAVP